MTPNQEANVWIRDRGLGRAIWFARQGGDPGRNLDRFTAEEPDASAEALAIVFGAALTALAAGAAIRAMNIPGNLSNVPPPTDPSLPAGTWRYRVILPFMPRPGYENVNPRWVTHNHDSDHMLTMEEIQRLFDEAEAFWRTRYNLRDEVYEVEPYLEAITVGLGAT